MKLDDLGRLHGEAEKIRDKAKKLGDQLAEAGEKIVDLDLAVRGRDEQIRRLQSEIERRGPVSDVDEAFLRAKGATARFVGYPQKGHVELAKQGQGGVVRAPTLAEAIALARVRWTTNRPAIARPSVPALREVAGLPSGDAEEVAELED